MQIMKMRNWKIQSTEGHIMLYGYVYGSAKHEDGAHVRTSAIRTISSTKDGFLMLTQNNDIYECSREDYTGGTSDLNRLQRIARSKNGKAE